MGGLSETPKGDRVHIAFFGLRNAGKSTLINRLTGQDVAIVSDVAGTTTDPVSKAMEILPLGPCLITDTAGLDDVGALGELRVKKTLDVLATTDIAVWVEGEAGAEARDGTSHAEARRRGAVEKKSEGIAEKRDWYERFAGQCRDRKIPVLVHKRGDDVEALKRRLAEVRQEDAQRPLVRDLVRAGDVVVCVCPQDGSAPKGRLILPQQQVVRELLDAGAVAVVLQPDQLAQVIPGLSPRFVITDSQAFKAVNAVVPKEVPLTSFSIVFARAKGDLAEYCAGVEAMMKLRDGDRVLIAEGCTHHRQCGDIGTVKLPAWIQQKTGKKLHFDFCSGNDFPISNPPSALAQSPHHSIEQSNNRTIEQSNNRTIEQSLNRTISQSNNLLIEHYALVVQCGGCMLTRRAVQDRIARCREAGVPITNYGICIAACHGITAHPDTCMVIR